MTDWSAGNTSLEACGHCGGIWLSGEMLREYRARTSGANPSRGGPWNPRLDRATFVEPTGELMAAAASAADAAGLSAADIAQLIADLLNGS